MKKPLVLLFFLFLSLLLSAQELRSPDGSFSLFFELDQGRLTYELNLNDNQVIAPSTLGLELADTPSLLNDFMLERFESRPSIKAGNRSGENKAKSGIIIMNWRSTSYKKG